MDERAYLKVKIKSLAEEARIIRKETKRAKSVTIKNGLALHRKGIVRTEARHTCLAYGFLRGRDYRQMEPIAYVEPNWTKVRRMVQKYGSHQSWTEADGWNTYSEKCEETKKHLEETLARFDQWVELAKVPNEVVEKSA